ncbi:MAG: hypothetical protein KJZ87_25010, partial [Thermoguttaceae bacterium]|nr:hypothetical protein [Thermoguttaceae bacterium]
MNTQTATLREDRAEPHEPGAGLRVSRYDQVASWIVSMLILVGISVVTLVIMVLSARIFARPEPQVFKAQ